MEAHPLVILVLQLAATLSISVVIIYLLQPALGPLLGEVCGSQAAADFWVNFTRLMVLIAPMLQVILMAPANAAAVEVIRSTLFHALGGVFLALATIGFVIWRVVLKDQSRIAAQQ